MVVVYILTVAFIILPFLPATGFTHWFFRNPDFVRIQTTVIQLVILILFLVLMTKFQWLQWTLLLLLVSSMIYQLDKIYPYSSLASKPPSGVKTKEKVSILAANVLQTNTEYENFISIVEHYDSDLVLTMESNESWEKALVKLEVKYPYQIKVPKENFYGMHLYSKKEISNIEIHELVSEEIPSIFFEYELSDGNNIQFICLHPEPPSPTESPTSKERDAELMIAGRNVRSKQKPTVVCGDMNDVVWSRITRLFRKMTGMIDPRVGRGFYSTFHAKYRFLRFPLDHLFHTNDVLVGRMERSNYFGSDHFAMYYEIHLKNNTKTEVPDLDESDQEVIEETISKTQE